MCLQDKQSKTATATRSQEKGLAEILPQNLQEEPCRLHFSCSSLTTRTQRENIPCSFKPPCFSSPRELIQTLIFLRFWHPKLSGTTCLCPRPQSPILARPAQGSGGFSRDLQRTHLAFPKTLARKRARRIFPITTLSESLYNNSTGLLRDFFLWSDKTIRGTDSKYNMANFIYT